MPKKFIIFDKFNFLVKIKKKTKIDSVHFHILILFQNSNEEIFQNR